MHARLLAALFLAVWALPAFAASARAQTAAIRSAEVVIPQNMHIPVPAGLRQLFPQGFVPGVGFGLNCAIAQADGSMVLHTLTGRGPALPGPTVQQDGAWTGSDLFVLPGYTPSIVTMKLTGNKAELVGAIPLCDEAGKPVSGLPPAPAVTGASVVVPLDLGLGRLPFAPNGYDPQGVAFDVKRGAYWIADSYRPALLRVSPRDGRVLEVLAAGGELEPFLATHRPGWGFSGVSLSPVGKVHTMMRGVLSVDGVPAVFSRIVEYDPGSERVRQMAYPIDTETFPDRAQVVTGDPVAYADKKVLVLEQGIDKEGKPRSLVFAADLSQGHNISRVINEEGKPTEILVEPAQWAKAGTRMVKKTLVLDLQASGFKESIVESMTLLSDGRTLAFMSGHGFGLQGQISGYSANKDGSPGLDPASYMLADGKKLVYGDQPSKAVFGIRPTKEVPRLWLVTLPKKVVDY